MGIAEAIFSAAFAGRKLHPVTGISTTFKHWTSVEDLKRCVSCYHMQGKIWRMAEVANPQPPLHPNGRCKIEKMTTIKAGTATINGADRADWWIMNMGKLPSYYVSCGSALSKGWRYGKWPSNFIPDKMITNGKYENKNGHLPNKPGRNWYEADINYQTGKRNNQRIVWSDDGLIFVTYDHYETFYEIVQGE